MTRGEAIKWMQEEKASFERAPDLNGCPMTAVWQEAIDVYDMAISALRAQQDQSPDAGKMMPITNADHIRAMSDEELAMMLKDYKDCSKNCIISNGKHCYQICEEESVLLKWLQKPAEEDDHGT